MGNWLSFVSYPSADAVSEVAQPPSDTSRENSLGTLALNDMNDQIALDILLGFEESLWGENARLSLSSSEPESEPIKTADEPECEPEHIHSEITPGLRSWHDFIRSQVRGESSQASTTPFVQIMRRSKE